MTTARNMALAALLAWAGAVMAQAAPTVSLDQAVNQVQRDTGGKVLSAEPHRFGRRLEYRIKVLTPEGHVRVIAVSSETGRSSTRTTKSFPGAAGGGKEKH